MVVKLEGYGRVGNIDRIGIAEVMLEGKMIITRTPNIMGIIVMSKIQKLVVVIVKAAINLVMPKHCKVNFTTRTKIASRYFILIT